VTPPPWLDWAQRLHAIAQNGLAFSGNEFDRLRYGDVQKIANEILALQTGGEEVSFERIFGIERGYATPKIDVRGVVLREGRVLLVKERSDGLWTLPGGYADVGMSVRETAEKEVHEESGFEVRARRLLAVYDRNKHDHPPFLYHIYKIFVHCDLLGGEATASNETEEADFFPLDELPPLSVARANARQIARMVELTRHPSWPPDFD
jgi:ADP-ribose pyrophosphatase YjhB (NUDIX family)